MKHVTLSNAAGLALWLSLASSSPGAHAGDQAVPANAVPTKRLELKTQNPDRVDFRVQFNYDKVGGPGGTMLYPAYGLAGFIAAIATHGAIIEGEKSRQRAEVEAKAQELLQPYMPVLREMRNAELLSQALDEPRLRPLVQTVDVASAGSTAAARGVIAPVFWLTADQRALVLELQTQWTEGALPAASDLRLRVVSSPLDADVAELAQRWTDKSGELLRRMAGELLVRGIALSAERLGALPDANAEGARFQTVRFMEGGTQRVERAQMLSDDGCGRALIRTLRGELLSVPLPAERVGASDCRG